VGGHVGVEGVQQGQLVTSGHLLLVCHLEQLLQAGTFQPTAQVTLLHRTEALSAEGQPDCMVLLICIRHNSAT